MRKMYHKWFLNEKFKFANQNTELQNYSTSCGYKSNAFRTQFCILHGDNLYADSILWDTKLLPKFISDFEKITIIKIIS